MKSLILAALAAAVLVAGPASARADEGKKDGDKKPRAEWAAKMKKRMAERLDLSPEQADRLEAAMKFSREATKPLREKARAADKKLADLVGAGTDAEVEAALKDADAARKALTEERRKLESSLSAILKPRQLAKLRVDRERMMRRRFAMMRRGHDKHGRDGWSHHRRDGDEDRGEHGDKDGRWGGHHGPDGHERGDRDGHDGDAGGSEADGQ
jgi:Spy/CpxP family protein refolding chaperone